MTITSPGNAPEFPDVCVPRLLTVYIVFIFKYTLNPEGKKKHQIHIRWMVGVEPALDNCQSTMKYI